MASRKCLICGSSESITRDHVVSRLMLRMLLGREEYPRFCSAVRKVNLQPMCGPCNNIKSSRTSDARSTEDHEKLVAFLEEFGIADEVVFEDPYDVFGDLVEKGPKLWLS